MTTRSTIYFLLSSTAVFGASNAAVTPPVGKKQTKPKLEILLFGVAVAQVPHISGAGTLPHDLTFHFCIRQHRYQYACARPLPPFVSNLSVPFGVA